MPIRDRNPELIARIARLGLKLAPIARIPDGLVYLDFPKNFLEYLLLNEDQLDGLAHFYSQSTPDEWTHAYPATMNWDKELLSRKHSRSKATDSPNPSPKTCTTTNDGEPPRKRQRNSRYNHISFWQLDTSTHWKENLWDISKTERLQIKRRKFGKFIGLVGCHTPDWEIEAGVALTIHSAEIAAKKELEQEEALEKILAHQLG